MIEEIRKIFLTHSLQLEIVIVFSLINCKDGIIVFGRVKGEDLVENV